MKSRRLLLVALMTGMMVEAGAAVAQANAAAAGSGFGTVNFATSCAPAVKRDFNHAVALLHSFEYDEARGAFLNVAAKDPNCAMAYWGAAMTHFHGLWGEVNVQEGRKLAAQAKATGGNRITPREADYIAAAAAIYAQDDAAFLTRAQAFSDGMAEVHAAYSNDDEAAIFYALSLDESAGKDPAYTKQRQCGAILEPMFQQHPDHPGIAHYMIHCYDNPALAEKGLPAAKRYAAIAPDSSHATHMPSHIFVRLGMWPETVEGNMTSMNAAERDKLASECESRNNELHAMHFLQYAYLQEGRMKDALSVVARAQALPPTQDKGCDAPTQIAAAYLLSSGEWKQASKLIPHDPEGRGRSNGLVWAALGVAAARGGELERARSIEQKLGDGNSFKLRVQAWIAEAEGDHDGAVKALRSAADMEDQTGNTWQAGPAREMLGGLLLRQGHAAEALAEFEKALAATPNLFNSLWGAAQAEEALGNSAAASKYYRQLTVVARDGDRPEVAEARRKLALAAGNKGAR